MRFGHTSLEFAPIAKQLVSGNIPDFSKFDIVEHVRRSLEIEHISVIEVTGDIEYIIPNSLSSQAISRLNDLKDELGHSYTIHLPLWSIELATFNESIRKGGVESIVSSINKLEPLEPEVFVLHSTGPLGAEFSHLKYPKQMVDMICLLMTGFSATSIEEIIAQTEIDPAKIAIENLDFPFDVTRDVVDEYGTGICFDTGHLLSKQSGEETELEFYAKHRDRIIELHLHDGRPTIPGEQGFIDHRTLGTGDMQVHEFLSMLVSDDFKGPLIFELTADEATKSLKLIEEVVPEALE